MRSPSVSAARNSAINGARKVSATPCAIGTRTSPQKNSSTDAPPTPPRARCSRSAAHAGHRPPRAMKIGASNATPATDRQSTAK